ncbi:MAG TPA: DNA replication and repair protein RecF [Lacunisphaera sp.]|nr:DNA replication and repair protein RecF [Lacunisphaera sp.]
MRFASVTLQDFRNLPLVEVHLAGRRTFLHGSNAQGKTNFLEALGYVTALRSFRGAETRALIALGRSQAGMAFGIEHETFGASRVTVTLRAEGREVMWEQGKVTRLGDFIGRFPTVVFSSQDNQFLRGPPALRRRWLDLTLAAMDPAYLTALQSCTRAVAERNILLKQGGRDTGAIEAFEHELAGHAVTLVAKRTAGIAELAAAFRAAHAGLVPESESAGLVYAPDSAAATRDEFAALLARSRPRDTLLKSTERGPHRDDIDLLLNGRPARQFASEGQQRCLVIALRLAQAAYFRAKGGVTPVLLCDDVLGELDPVRRARFWASLEHDPQVVATGTVLPEGSDWQVLAVEQGGVSAK